MFLTQNEKDDKILAQQRGLKKLCSFCEIMGQSVFLSTTQGAEPSTSAL